MMELYESDLKDYEQLKTMRAKYESANQILAKIMKIFLLELSLRLTSQDIDSVTQPLASDDPNDSSSSSARRQRSCPQPEPRDCPTLSEMIEEQGLQIASKDRVVMKKEMQWRDNEKKLSEIGESEMDEFLDSVNIPNFFDRISQSKNANVKTYQKFIGSYSGVLTYIDPETPPADITLDVDGQLEDDKIVGQIKTTLSRNGEKPFSSSTSNGNLQNVKTIDGVEATFLDLGGKSGFLQIYFINNNLFANYYRQTELTEFKKEGKARLYRR